MPCFLNAGESAIHEACSKFNTTEFQARREDFQASVRELLSSRYQALNTTIDDLQVGTNCLSTKGQGLEISHLSM